MRGRTGILLAACLALGLLLLSRRTPPPAQTPVAGSGTAPEPIVPTAPLTTAAPPSVVDSLTDLEIVEGARHRERDEASLRARVIRRYAEDLAVRSASMKAFAAHQLRSLAPLRPDEASVVVPALMSALGDPTVEVRGEAALTLGVMGQHAVPAVERLKLVAEHDEDQGVRQLARDAILKIEAAR